MNPLDQPLIKLSMGWGREPYRDPAAVLLQEHLHRAAVARRRKVKRGGKR